ncbi:MAG: tRNA uridine-5-carboxymethylaminomethyl(34) synthesis GTPase MnmE [Bacteroidaceae bacterium]|nr:tRNA uridine-5-carboxymethylaminomethyl(34) synthesis GTPase MnmE [Bacteroidaceae bacterium]
MEDTICAIATAPGGAIGIVRISGPETFTIARQVCSRMTDATPPRTSTFTPILDDSGQVLDEAVVTLFCAPHSYTGEDCAEISCHGSRYILNKVLETLIHKGARLANPGEFTQRAFLNGKMDLSQAEAVADLIAARNKATHDIALSQLRGHFSSELKDLRNQLLHLTSLLELELDFSDHEDLEFADRTELLTLAQTIEEHIARLTKSFKTGQALKQGIPVAIVGKTNVGKSTLLNQLVDDDRAIVSDIHGTTRDTIEETMDINGVSFRFIDTAGLRETSDKVEQIGIERSIQAIKQARILIWLLDERPSLSELDEMRFLGKDKISIYVHNKLDLIDVSQFKPYIFPLSLISAKNGDGISNLKHLIYKEAQRAGLTANTSDVIVTNARHYDALIRADNDLQHVLEGMGAMKIDERWTIVNPSLSGDLLAEDLRLVLSDISDITGEGQITPQETLNNIFSHFCVGK